MSSRLGACPTCTGLKDSRAAQCNKCRSVDRPARAGERHAAQLRGELIYFVNEPCGRGHQSERYVSSGGCIECLRERSGHPTPTRLAPALCECCNSGNGLKRLALDHDHVTGQFRGWLCDNCNMGIGQLGDTKEGLLMALHYMEKNH